jgi:hypothetical protein
MHTAARSRSIWTPRVWAAVLCLALPSIASAKDSPPATRARLETFAPTDQHTFGHRLLLWIPNRVFDVFDIVRLRVRAGPGFSASVRATELADVALGGHATLFAGLPGPRNSPQIPLPVGFENYAGLEVSVVDVGSEDDRHGPQYGPLEVGVGAQILLLGLDIGVDPFDALDLLAGIVFLDPKGDDF